MIPVMQNNYLVKSKFIQDLQTCFPLQIERLLHDLKSLGEHTRKKHKSLLTPGGCPWEINYHFHKRDLVYTIDPMTNKVLRNLIAEGVYQTIKLDKTCTNTPWISIRGRDTDVKIYLHPSSNKVSTPRKIRNIIKRNPIIEKLVLLGYHPFSRETEFYFKITSASKIHLHELFKNLGISSQLPWVLDQFSYLSSLSFRNFSSKVRLGLSLFFSSELGLTSTLFMHSVELFHSNEEATHKISSLAEDLGYETCRYRKLTCRASSSKIRFPMHSIVGLKMSQTGLPKLSVGISPH